MNFNKSEEEQKKILLMHFEQNRLASFSDWPFDKGSKCTPEKMSEAGFYHCPTDQEPDLVKCFVCQKELDGWEPTDDPWAEHESHSPSCPFLHLPNPKEMTVADLLKLEYQRYEKILKTTGKKKIVEFEAYAQEARHQIEALIN